MELFVILRRDGWRSGEELGAAAERSTKEGERRGDVRWIRSYVLEEGQGLGTVCIYEAESEEAIRGHAEDATSGCPVTRRARTRAFPSRRSSRWPTP